MQKITPHLWFDAEAKAAAELYTSIFPDSKIKNLTTIHNTPSGDADIISINLMGYDFMMINAGPFFKFTPAVSFLVACKTKEEVVTYWEKLSVDGSVMMNLGEYPFSEKYGWLQDRFGLFWQIMYMGEREVTQRIIPTMMFVGEQCGKTEEAINFYASIFNNSQIESIMRYNEGEGPDKAGTIRHVSFSLEGQKFAAMDSALQHNFTFNEAISFIVYCETQAEIDHYWDQLSANPKAEQCGWLKDMYGFSWQIVPTIMNEMFEVGDPKKMAQVTEAFLKMKKFNITELQAAYNKE